MSYIVGNDVVIEVEPAGGSSRRLVVHQLSTARDGEPDAGVHLIIQAQYSTDPDAPWITVSSVTVPEDAANELSRAVAPKRRGSDTNHRTGCVLVLVRPDSGEWVAVEFADEDRARAWKEEHPHTLAFPQEHLGTHSGGLTCDTPVQLLTKADALALYTDPDTDEVTS